MCLPVPLTVRDMLCATDSQGHAARHPGRQSVTCCTKCQLHNVSARATDSQGHAAHHRQSVTCCAKCQMRNVSARATDSQGHAARHRQSVTCSGCGTPLTVSDMLCTTDSQGHAARHPGQQSVTVTCCGKCHCQAEMHNVSASLSATDSQRHAARHRQSVTCLSLIHI